MTGYALRRILGAIPTLFVIVTLAFFMMRAAPGGPFDSERRLPPEVERNVKAAYNLDKPVVLFSHQADVPLAVATMKAGAVDFLLHPFDAATLIASVENALKIGWKASKRSAEMRAARARLAVLTPRERHVMDQLVMGQPNKMVAHTLGISARTVEFHRAHVMDKLGARNMSDLVRLALAAEQPGDQPAEIVTPPGQPRAKAS